MRYRHQVALAAGSVILTIGIIATAFGVVPRDGTRTRTISVVPDFVCPPNETDNVGLWVLMKFSLWYQGELSCSLSWSPSLTPHEAGYDLGWLLMGQRSFDYYKETGTDSEAIFFILTDHDSVTDIHLPTTGSHYLVLANQNQIDREYNVTVHYRITGFDVRFLAAGLGMLILGCPILLLARRLKGECPEKSH